VQGTKGKGERLEKLRGIIDTFYLVLCEKINKNKTKGMGSK
jgi:hypothetical protein